MRSVIFLTTLFLSVAFGSLKAATVQKTLYLNAGMFTTENLSTFPALAFNSSSVFSQRPEVIRLLPWDILELKVINTDTLLHGFEVQGITSTNLTMSPGDSASLSITFPNFGLFLFFDNQNFPAYRYLGASGMILVDPMPASPHFFWNVSEQQETWNLAIGAGQSVNWSQYKPTWYVLNGRGKPGILLDSTAMVTGNVGDTILISIANTGLSLHSIHFHGYHCKILYASEDASFIGREKDTFPFESMQTMILQLVPDKPGKYPVHDHNLIAVTGGNTYSNGIFLFLDIQ